jgi:phage terminase small subunit
MDQMRKFMAEFGLTPSSRSRVQVGPVKKASDDESDALVSPVRPN